MNTVYFSVWINLIFNINFDKFPDRFDTIYANIFAFIDSNSEINQSKLNALVYCERFTYSYKQKKKHLKIDVKEGYNNKWRYWKTKKKKE